MLKWTPVVLVVFAVLFGTCYGGMSYSYAYVSDHSMPVDFEQWSNQYGFNFVQYTTALLNNPISGTIRMILYQNDGGLGFNSIFQTNIEDWVNSGGTLLYYGRGSLDSGDAFLMNMLGLSARTIGSEGDFVFQSPISQDPLCNPITNGQRRNIRGIVPYDTYHYWVTDHLNYLNEVLPDTFAGATGCLPSSANGGYHMWTIRPLGSGRIVFMATSTYVAEELWKPGFYQAGFLNLFYLADSGMIYGDPHVVTLTGQAFEMPIQSFNRYFNFFSTSAVNVNGFISPMLGIAPGLWVTQIGVEFTERDSTHQFHSFIDEELNFHYILDDRELLESEETSTWTFSLQTSNKMIGTWHDRSRFVSTGLFTLHGEDGSVVIVQAVEWRDAPSFSVKVNEPDYRLRNVSPGLLQHPLTETRDVETVPNVFVYERESLFP